MQQNPQWSLSCFLALLLPLSGLQPEVTGMVETNVLDNQLQTGQVEMPTLVGAVKDSGKKTCLTGRLRTLRFSIHFAFPAL